ncbi:MAG TPA: hypothetical protein PKM45_13845, partial [Giesbergeria sp.]|nr:hypothetical protein [Giesbergeria sp.]
AAMTDPKINLEAAAAEVGATLPAEVTRALQADMEGRVVDVAQDDGITKPAAQSPIERAKAVGIKGLRAGMSDETLRQRVKSYLAGERAARLIAAGKQTNLPQYQGVSEKDARALGTLVESYPYSVNTSGAQWVLDARGVTTADALVQGGLLKPDNGNYKHELTPVGKEIARQALRSPIGDASIGDMLTELEESKPKTGNGAMFSRTDEKVVTNPTAVKMRRAMVQRTVDALAKGWAKAPNVTVVDNMQDERVPEVVRQADEAQRSQGAMGEPEGFWYRGQVYLVASALPTSADAARVLYHEVLGHHGLRGHFGKDLDRVLDQVIKLRRKDVQAKAQEYGLDMSNPEHAGYAAEEVLAELAQSRPDLGFVQRAIAAIRNFLRAHVPGFKALELTDADIVQGYLLPARGWVERGADAGSAADGPMLSRSGGTDTEAQRQFKATERAYGGKAAYDRAKAAGKTKLTYGQWVQVRTPNFKAWFGDWENDPASASKVTDPDTGEPMVVYHGTGADFSVFDSKKRGSHTREVDARQGFFLSSS